MRRSARVAQRVRALLIGVVVLALGAFAPSPCSPALAARSVPTEQTAPLTRDPVLQSIVYDAADSFSGRFGIVVHHLSTGQYAAVNAGMVFSSASLYKLGVLYTVYADVAAGLITLDEPLTVTAETQRYEDTPSLMVGETITVADALERMITWSDNTSAILLVDRVGWAHVDQTMADFGLSQTRVSQPEPSTQPADMAILLEAIATNGAISANASAAMRSLLLAQEVNDRLPVLLPAGVPIAHKTGELFDARHDVGIVYSPSGAYVIVAMTDQADTGEATAAIANLSSAVYDYFVYGEAAPVEESSVPATDTSAVWEDEDTITDLLDDEVPAEDGLSEAWEAE